MISLVDDCLAQAVATAILAVAIVVATPGGQAVQVLRGTIDIHVHSDPDNVPRSIDGIDVAKLARSKGMRGIVLKNHYDPTAGLAFLARKEAPGLEVFGGIDLNLTVGGMNPVAVEHMTQVAGGWGRLVWMSTFDAENQVRDSRENCCPKPGRSSPSSPGTGSCSPPATSPRRKP
jgi:hypothetical protein